MLNSCTTTVAQCIGDGRCGTPGDRCQNLRRLLFKGVLETGVDGERAELALQAQRHRERQSGSPRDPGDRETYETAVERNGRPSGGPPTGRSASGGATPRASRTTTPLSVITSTSAPSTPASAPVAASVRRSTSPSSIVPIRSRLRAPVSSSVGRRMEVSIRSASVSRRPPSALSLVVQAQSFAPPPRGAGQRKQRPEHDDGCQSRSDYRSRDPRPLLCPPVRSQAHCKRGTGGCIELHRICRLPVGFATLGDPDGGLSALPAFS